MTNPANYLLFSDAGDGYDTVDCATGVDAGDTAVAVDWVRGTDAELEDASRAFGNHALALQLLATYLHDIPGHRFCSDS